MTIHLIRGPALDVIIDLVWIGMKIGTIAIYDKAGNEIQRTEISMIPMFRSFIMSNRASIESGILWLERMINYR